MVKPRIWAWSPVGIAPQETDFYGVFTTLCYSDATGPCITSRLATASLQSAKKSNEKADVAVWMLCYGLYLKWVSCESAIQATVLKYANRRAPSTAGTYESLHIYACLLSFSRLYRINRPSSPSTSQYLSFSCKYIVTTIRKIGTFIGDCTISFINIRTPAGFERNVIIKDCAPPMLLQLYW